MGKIADELTERLGGDVLQADGLDDAIIGYVERCGEPIRLVYDREKAIDILMHDCGDREAAVEYFDFNTAGAWVGEMTPFWFTSIEDM
tara:strand:- start:19654 stop:19917 length:264 start_codon:yes stop_codon:yes gene_type:complete